MKTPEKVKDLLIVSLHELKERQPSNANVLDGIIAKVEADEEWEKATRNFIALALFGKAMLAGPESHPYLATIVHFLKLEDEMLAITMEFLRRPKVQVLPVESAHTGRCESLWRPDLECPNAAEFILRVRSNKGFAVMCAVHAKGYLEQYRGNDLDVIAYTEEELHACTEARKQVEANQP